MFTRPPHELPAGHPLCRALARALERRGESAEPTGMSFWTDAAVQARAGTPAVLFGPRGAGLHSREEYEIDSVLACCDVLVDLARRFLLNRTGGSERRQALAAADRASTRAPEAGSPG